MSAHVYTHTQRELELVSSVLLKKINKRYGNKGGKPPQAWDAVPKRADAILQAKPSHWGIGSRAASQDGWTGYRDHRQQ